MGLRCSLLGHDFGEPEVEREREERGNEVVETVREVKTCARCGSESVVSENTEVRSIRPADEVEADSEREDAGSGVQSAIERVEHTDESPEPELSVDADGSEFEDVSAAEDDGVILDAEDEPEDVPADREPGEWPDADDTRQNERNDVEAEAGDDGGAEVIDADAEADANADADGETEHAPWPDTDGEDEGFDAEPSSGGLSVSQVEEEANPETEREDTEYVESEGFASSGSLDPGRGEDGDTLVCPQCGHRTRSTGSSLRAGDICPECRKGYLAEE